MRVTEVSEIFVDDRGPHRVLRVTWHPEHRMAVLSLWDKDLCLATFRLPAHQVPAFVQTLTSGLLELNTAAATADHREQVMNSLREDEKTTTSQPSNPSPSAGEMATRFVGRALDTVIDGCTRLRKRMDRR